MKEEIRLVGWDDTSIPDRPGIEMTLVGVVTRGGKQLEGLLTTTIKPDGLNATSKLAQAINESNHKEQIQAILLDGITFGGFNVVDIQKLNQSVSLPVVVLIKGKPDLKSFRSALHNLPNSERRWRAVKKAGSPEQISIPRYPQSNLYFQRAGISSEKAKQVLRLSTTHGAVPEPLRLADIIASGLGEQR